MLNLQVYSPSEQLPGTPVLFLRTSFRPWASVTSRCCVQVQYKQWLASSYNFQSATVLCALEAKGGVLGRRAATAPGH